LSLFIFNRKERQVFARGANALRSYNLIEDAFPATMRIVHYFFATILIKIIFSVRSISEESGLFEIFAHLRLRYDNLLYFWGTF
jgi:hypothetical protein